MKIQYYTLLFALAVSYSLSAQNELLIPPVQTGPVFDLNLKNGTKEFFSGFSTNTMGVNGDLLGPTLFLDQGGQITVNVHNNLDEPTTIHWHGMHVSAANDGGPHTIIDAGETWSPQFTVLDKAATYWYHPHLHEHTAEHVTKGIAGFIIVKDPEEAALDLPRTYGVDDFPLVLQSRAFDASKQLVVETASDDIMMINGTIDPFLEVPAQVVRLRLLNGSTSRVYNLGFEGDQPFHQIATDGGLLSAPVPLTRLMLAPGERAEILLNISGEEGSSFYLKSFASELENGIYGAANPGIMPMGSIPGYAANSLNGTDFNILRLEVIPATSNPVSVIPTGLVAQNPIPENTADKTRSFTFRPEQMGPSAALNGPFTINDAFFNLEVINETVPLNNTEIWTLTNFTPISHPFHIHDVQFYILDINGNSPPENQRGRKDVVLVPPMGGTVRFITKFEDFADPNTPYMYHCHMLNHEDEGMMGQFVVVDNTTSTNMPQENQTSIHLFPNPASESVFIQSNSEIEKILVYDQFGRLIQTNRVRSVKLFEMGLTQLPAGVYILKIFTEDGASCAKLVVE